MANLKSHYIPNFSEFVYRGLGKGFSGPNHFKVVFPITIFQERVWYGVVGDTTILRQRPTLETPRSIGSFGCTVRFYV